MKTHGPSSFSQPVHSTRIVIRSSFLQSFVLLMILGIKSVSGSPELERIADLEAIAEEPGGSYVFFPPPGRSDARDPHVSYNFSPASGSFFPIGTTEVVRTASNTNGDTARRTFSVTVKKMEPRFSIENQRMVFEPAPGWFAETATSLGRGDWEPFLPADTGFAVPLPEPGPDPPQEPKLFIRLTPEKKVPGIGTGYKNGPPPDLYRYVATGLFRQAREVILPPSISLLEQKGDLLRVDEDDFDESGTTELLPAGDSSDWSQELTLPFKFYFYGLPFTRFCVNRDGLLTFSTEVANSPQVVSTTQVPGASEEAAPITAFLPLPNPELPDYTISCFHEPNQSPQIVERWVVAKTYGQKPNRQVWIMFHHEVNFGQGSRRANAIVLEEGRNRVLLVDMASEYPGRFVCGVQRDAGTSQQLPHRDPGNLAASESLRCRMVGNSPIAEDNDYWCFTPYRRNTLVSGEGHSFFKIIDERVFEFLENNNVPGLSLSVGRGERMIYNKSYGFSNVEKGIEMRPWHRNPIGSCSKILTTAGVFKLIEQGVYKGNVLDQPVFDDPKILGTGPLLQGLVAGSLNGTHTPQDLAQLQDITMRHFMTHTSRFATTGDALQAAIDYAGGDYAGVSRSQIFRWSMANMPRLPGPVGSEYTYSNSGIHLLGLAIENATGEDYIDWIRENLLFPMGIQGVVVGPDHESGNTPVDSYRYTRYGGGAPHLTSAFNWGTFNQPILAEWNYSSTRLVGPPGGLIATSEEMLRFLFGFNETNLPQRPNVLSNDLRKEMLSVPFKALPMDKPPAHTWNFDQNSRVYWHNGDLP